MSAQDELLTALEESGMGTFNAESLVGRVTNEGRIQGLYEAAHLAQRHVKKDHKTEDCAPCAMAALLADELRRMAAAGQAPAPQSRRLDPDGRCHHCRHTPERCDTTGCGGRHDPYGSPWSAPQPETAPSEAIEVTGVES